MKIKVAIIGAGIGREHLRAYLKLPNLFDVKCICDLDTERAEEVVISEGAEPQAIEIFKDFDAVVKRPDIDLVDICLPPHLHFSMSVKALRAGKNVVCEKPLVSSLREADELINIAEGTGKTVFPVFQYRYGPAIHKLTQLIRHGLAGKPLVANIETHWNRESDYYANPWRGTWKGEQGGAVLGHAIHNHDLMCLIMGPIKRLSGFGATRVNDIETEDCASIAFEMENGSLATSSITLGAHTDTTRLRFCFENLTAESDLLPYTPADGNWRFNVRGTKHSQAELDAFISVLSMPETGFIGYFEAIANALEGNESDVVSLQDGRRSIELVTAIYSAFRNTNSVSLPLDATHPLYSGWQPEH